MSHRPRQLDLFGGPEQTGVPAHTVHRGAPTSAPYSNDSTSRAAAEAITPDLGSLQRRVAEFIRGRGAYGATRDEIESELGMLGSTARPRVTELLALGLIEETTEKRPTRTGRMALILKAVQGNQPE